MTERKPEQQSSYSHLIAQSGVLWSRNVEKIAEQEIFVTDSVQKPIRIDVPLPNWVRGYIGELEQLGWQFVQTRENGISPESLTNSTAYHDINTPELLSSWKETQSSAEVSIVIVMPDKDILKLPAGSLAYSATSLEMIRDLRSDGVDVDTLRIMSPCHINAYCSGGNVDRQLQNAEISRELINGYKEMYYPELSSVSVIVDCGKEVNDLAVINLNQKIEALHTEQPDVLEAMSRRLKERAQSHRRGDVSAGIDERLLPIMYLLSHPEAWGYSSDEILFANSETRRINYLPASELSYLLYMTQIGSAWSKADVEIATLISSKHITPPYHGRKGEPSLGGLLEWSNPSSVYSSTNEAFSASIIGQSNAETIYALQKIETDVLIPEGKANLWELLKKATTQSQKNVKRNGVFTKGGEKL